MISDLRKFITGVQPGSTDVVLKVSQINDLLAELDIECEWTPEDDCSDHYAGTCGIYFMFNDGGPMDNGFVFCPKCGKKLKEIPWGDPEDDAE